MANQYRSVLASGGATPTGGDALPAEVLSGKTFTNDNGSQTGTMPNRGAVSQTLSEGQSYTIPEGYHNGNGTVSAPSNPLANKYYKDGATALSDIVSGQGITVSSGKIILFPYGNFSTLTTDSSSIGCTAFKSDGSSISLTGNTSFNISDYYMLVYDFGAAHTVTLTT